MAEPTRRETPPAATATEQGPPYLGPVTEAAYMARDRQEGGPPPLIAEWEQALEGSGFVLLLAGAWRGEAPPGRLSWGHLLVGREEAGETAVEGEQPPTRTPLMAAKIERLLSPLAHESRVRIMQVLSEGSRTSGELSAATGLQGGNLYHHLRDLIHAGYVREVERGYGLTKVGLQLLLTVTCIAWEAVEDRDTEGLVIGEAW